MLPVFSTSRTVKLLSSFVSPVLFMTRKKRQAWCSKASIAELQGYNRLLYVVLPHFCESLFSRCESLTNLSHDNNFTWKMGRHSTILIAFQKRENILLQSLNLGLSHPQVAGIQTNENMVDKLLHHSGIKHENNRDLGSVSTGIPAEVSSSIVKESSSISSGLNGISEEADSFHQLQRVMEQLDISTKLRIRDSLYRLAQSAEQRIRHVNLNNGSGDDRRTSGAFVDDGAYRCTEYLDMETDTNSIDRSIAHLLFHRPSNSSVMPDSLALKSPSMIFETLLTPPVIDENLTSAGENAAEPDKGTRV